MKSIYIKGVADGMKACCAVSVMDSNTELFFGHTTFDKVIKLKDRDIPVLKGRGQLQAAIYALVWGVLKLNGERDVKVYTNSMAVATWINKRILPEFYTDLFGYYLNFSENLNVEAIHVNVGVNAFLNDVRKDALELLYGKAYTNEYRNYRRRR